MKICLNCNSRFGSSSLKCPSCHYSPENISGYPVYAPELLDAESGFDPGFFEKLFELEAEHFWFRSRNRLILWAMDNYFPKAKTFFEIGCGTGYVLDGIKKHGNIALYGSDIFIEALQFAERRVKGAVFSQMGACRIPFEDEFDAIGAFDVLEHIVDDTSALAQMHRALKSNGGLILTVPQHPFLWSSYDEYSHHARRYTANELRQKMQNAGFQVIRQTSFVSLLLPLLLLHRVKSRQNDVAKELHIGRRANRVLERVMDVEIALIRKGVSFHIGGSLITVAKKIEGVLDANTV